MSTDNREFHKADRAITRATVAIEQAITTLLDTTLPLESVACDYVVERLITELMKRNPEAMDYLNKRTGAATMRVANALMDWRDVWADR
jgi:hypothetical protein